MQNNDSWQRYRLSFALVGIAVLLVVWMIWPKGEMNAPEPLGFTTPTESVSQETPPAPTKLQMPLKLAQYEGGEPQLEVFLSGQNRIETMAFEEYIVGVVAAEMDPDWPREALEAQAILARSYTLRRIEETGGVPARNADASTDINEFQAYDSSRISDAVRQAVADTRGMVLVYQNEYVHGWFHADSGGVTATAEEGLGYNKTPPPYIIIVDDSAVRQPPEEIETWTIRFPRWQVANAANSVGAGISSVDSISTDMHGPSGRVTSFNINGQIVDAVLLRSALGSTALKSLLLTAEPYIDGDEVVFQGTGYGHGVGMSQYGAKGMAEEGKTATEILQFYFGQTDIAQLYT